MRQNELQSSDESSALTGDDSVQSDTETQRVLTKKKGIIRDAINKKVSRFYININQEKELDEDFDSDELENYSEDEIESDVEDYLKENNKKISSEHAK